LESRSAVAKTTDTENRFQIVPWLFVILRNFGCESRVPAKHNSLSRLLA
jgi:hypothetical protein